jgi:ribosomal protein L19E
MDLMLKCNGLLYKTCDRCRCTDDKCRIKHREQLKVYRDQYNLDNQNKRKEYREVNKDNFKGKKNIVKQVMIK